MIKEPQLITKDKIIQFNTLIHKLKLTHHKAEMIGGATNGRTESSKELYTHEAAELIQQLQAMATPSPSKGGEQARTWQPKAGEQQRRKIIAIAHNMGWYLPPSGGLRGAVDMNRINQWCIKFGFGHKKLNDYTAAELPKLVSIFESVYKQFLKGI